MKYIFFFLAGVCAFMSAYFLNTSTKVKHISLQEVSDELQNNQKYADEIEHFNKRNTGEVAAHGPLPVDDYLQNVISEKDMNPSIYMHLAKVEPTAEMYQRQIEEITALAKKDPAKTMADYRELLNTLMANDKVMEYGLTMVQMSQVPELQEEVASLVQKDLKELNVQEIDPKNVKSMEEENRRLSDDKYVNSLNMMYHAYLNTQMAQEKNPLNETIDIIVKNNHSDVRRSIASTYAQLFPASQEDLSKGLESEGIKLNIPTYPVPVHPGANQ